jgi:integrase
VLCCGGSSANFNASSTNAAKTLGFVNRTGRDSQVYIEQIGNDNEITVNQSGTRNNYTEYNGNGSYNSVTISQTGNNSTTSNYLFPNFRKNDGDRPMHSQGFQKNWEALREHLGITQGRFHDLRHTYCTNLFMNPKINPVLACQALGMSMQTAESVYIHPRDEHYRLITENFDYSEFV